jgi:hypothetical protein
MVISFLVLKSHDVKPVDDPILIIVLEGKNNITRSDVSESGFSWYESTCPANEPDGNFRRVYSCQSLRTFG